MWSRLAGTGSHSGGSDGRGETRRVGAGAVGGPPPVSARPSDRRAYYRVSGMLPVRVRPLGPEELDAAIFDLSLPDPLLQPIGEEEADGPMAARLRRIEEKLRPRPLSGRDRRSVVFSGSGLRLDVDFAFERGDAFAVEILLPPPYLRTLRAVAFAVGSADAEGRGPGARRPLALELRHMESEERDALVAYSYDLQRFDLRHRSEGA